MKSLSLLILSLIATQAYANLLEGLEHAHGHGDHGHDHAHDHHGEHGDHGHGEHGDHGHEHADHGAHGEHGDNGEHGAHGDHGAHDEHGAHGEHGDHGEHGAHGDHAEGHHDHAEGDHHQDVHNTVNNDAFANALASDLGGGFLSSNPAPSNDFGAQPSNDLSQGFLQSNPAPTQAPVQASRQNTQAASSSSNQGKQLLDDGGLGGPKYNTVPETSFRCEDQATGGYFADPEADCQVFHICLNGDNLGSFLCPNGTLFHQQFFVCDWWFNVDCNVAPDSYNLNAAIGVVPEEQKK